ncbi:MAG: NTP/NDP exchange transporter [Coxiellaceae bacterium]|nr:NTP/NDP exchange transporter [Coxiellaceae bacterium]
MKKLTIWLQEKVVPIHKHELSKFMCLAAMMIIITYIHTMLKISKDALVIHHLHTEAISAIKLWLVTPLSILFMFAYIKLADIFSRSKLFHVMTWFFVSYFALFALVFYPNHEALSIYISPETQEQLPAMKYIFTIISSWDFCLFYVFSEMWVTIMLSISLWQAVNHITSIEESKRFYPLFGLTAQFGMMFAGTLSKSFVTHGTDWQPTLNNVTISLIVGGVLLSICIVLLGKVIGIEKFNSRSNIGGIVKTKKPKISFTESLKVIASSKPILLITSLLLCYNISINLAEGVWKKSIEIHFGGDANLIHYFMSNINLYISILSIAFALLGVYIVRACKWKTTALITPIIFAIVGVMFFLFMVFKDIALVFSVSMPALAMAVYFGAVHNIAARSTKHTLFDATKEMAYIPLDDDLKTKGKAAAEMIGMRFGKGSGAFIQQVLLTIFSGLTLLDLAPAIAGIFVIVMLWWLYSTLALNKELHQKQSDM